MFVVLLLEFFVEPAAAINTGDTLEFGFHFPVIAGDETLDAAFALDHDGQRGRLHAADRCFVKTAFLRVERRHRARAVDADQPVGFRTATCSIGQRLHFGIGAQMGKAFADGGRRHRLQPQATHRLLFFPQRMLRDITENQLAFAARVTGVDQPGNILALDQAGQQL